jgi:hypothetical protein
MFDKKPAGIEVHATRVPAAARMRKRNRNCKLETKGGVCGERGMRGIPSS